MTHMMSTAHVNFSRAAYPIENVSGHAGEPAYYPTYAVPSAAAGAAQPVVVIGFTLNQGLLATVRFAVFSVVILVILCGNALTMLAVATTDRLRIKTYALTTSLAAADFILGLIYIDYIVHETISSSTCSMATYKSAVRPIERMVLYVSFIHIPAIATDRFVAIVHPLHYEDRMTPSTIWRIIAALWAVAAATSLPPYVGFATAVVRPQSCILTLWPMFDAIVELLYYSISSVVVVFVYSRIWSTAMHHETLHRQYQQQQIQVSTVSKSVRFSIDVGESDGHQTRAYGGNSRGLPPVDEIAVDSADETMTSSRRSCWPARGKLVRKHRATRTIMTILGVFIVMWFPYMLSRLLGVVFKDLKALTIVQIFQTAASIFGTLSFGLNVFVYSLTNSVFMRAFKRILHVGTNQVHPSISTVSDV